MLGELREQGNLTLIKERSYWPGPVTDENICISIFLFPLPTRMHTDTQIHPLPRAASAERVCLEDAQSGGTRHAH